MILVEIWGCDFDFPSMQGKTTRYDTFHFEIWGILLTFMVLLLLGGEASQSIFTNQVIQSDLVVP